MTPQSPTAVATERLFKVTAYHRTARIIHVRAANEAEALAKAKRGEIVDVIDSEPEADIFVPPWTAREIL